MYVARDKDGDLYLYKEKPIRNNNYQTWKSSGENPHDFYKIDASLFPEVSWEDEEPIEVEIVNKRE